MTEFEFIDCAGAKLYNLISVLSLQHCSAGRRVLVYMPNQAALLIQSLENNPYKTILCPSILDANSQHNNLAVTQAQELDPATFAQVNDILISNDFPLPKYHARFKTNLVLFGADHNDDKHTAQAREVYAKMKKDYHQTSFKKYSKDHVKKLIEALATPVS